MKLTNWNLNRVLLSRDAKMHHEPHRLFFAITGKMVRTKVAVRALMQLRQVSPLVYVDRHFHAFAGGINNAIHSLKRSEYVETAVWSSISFDPHVLS